MEGRLRAALERYARTDARDGGWFPSWLWGPAGQYWRWSPRGRSYDVEPIFIVPPKVAPEASLWGLVRGRAPEIRLEPAPRRKPQRTRRCVLQVRVEPREMPAWML